MARCRYLIVKMHGETLLEKLTRAKLVSHVRIGDDAIIARHGVNKTTLKKILAKDLRE